MNTSIKNKPSYFSFFLFILLLNYNSNSPSPFPIKVDSFVIHHPYHFPYHHHHQQHHQSINLKNTPKAWVYFHLHHHYSKWTFKQFKQQHHRHEHESDMKTTSPSDGTNQPNLVNIMSLEEEIQQLRLEAWDKVQALEKKTLSQGKKNTDPIVLENANVKSIDKKEERQYTNTARSLSFYSKTSSSSSSSLEDTQWKIVLNIGREKGTWMPLNWGAKGDRLLLTLHVVFTSSQLYERDEFLGGVGGSRILHVVNQQIIIAPTITQGERIYTNIQQHGGWRILPGQGPAGSDLLRFFIDLDDTISQSSSSSDVYCPKGRIYCSCGYFPNRNKNIYTKEEEKDSGNNSPKDLLRKNIEQLQEQIVSLEQDFVLYSSNTWISIGKIKKYIQLFQLKSNLQKMTRQFNYISFLQPEDDRLSYTINKQVALTKEGGVCCKVTKAFGEEYHILGRFVIVNNK